MRKATLLLICVLVLVPWQTNYGQENLWEKFTIQKEVNSSLELDAELKSQKAEEVHSDTSYVKLTKNRMEELTLSEEKWEQTNSVGSRKAKKTIVKADVSLENWTGVFLERDYKEESSREYSAFIEISKSEGSDSLTLLNFWGTGEAIKAGISGNLISIPPQLLYTHNTYGPIYIYSLDWENRTYSTTEPIVGMMNEEGIITLDSWGAFITEGTYAGYNLGTYLKSELIRPNGTMKDARYDGNWDVSTIEYYILVEQKYDNEITIINFANNGSVINATLSSDKTVTISPQYIYTNILYGDFYCYPADWSKSSSAIDGVIQGKGEENKIALGNWGVFARYMTSTSALRVITSEINTTHSIQYPQELFINFDGEGTSQSPYQLKTPDDLKMLSQSVNSGNDYKGKYFRLQNDLDVASMVASTRFRPIGNEENPFAGTFDGNGKTISNFRLEGGGYDCIGLFGAVSTDGLIKDLTMTNVSYTGTGNYIGGIVGKCTGNIDNCHVKGKLLTGGIMVGGIAGHIYQEVKNSSFVGEITGVGDVGGIAGQNQGAVTNCYASASVSMPGYYSMMHRACGGIVGSMIKGPAHATKIQDSYFAGTVSDPYGYAFLGGIVGESLTGSINRCFNTGIITSVANSDNGWVGGIVGYVLSSDLVDCYNTGNISAASERTGGIAGQIVEALDFGGGVIPSSMKNVYNTALVISASSEEQRALVGICYSEDILENLYFDRQTTGIRDKEKGLLTSAMVTGQGLSGFDSSVWVFTEGLYPRLRGIHDNDIAYLSSAPMLLNGEETIRKVKSNIKVSTQNNVYWKVYDGNTFADQSDGLVISGSEVALQNIYSSEILVAFEPNGENYKFYTLALVPQIFEGEGTEQSPYLIKSKDDLIKLNEAIVTYVQPHEEDYFQMTNNIDLNYDEGFSGIAAIGNDNYYFSGIFDGNGYAIHKLKIASAKFDDAGTAVTTGSYLYAGLFGVCSQYSTIKNLTIAEDCDLTFWGYSGGVVGYTDGKIENCKNYAPINAVSSYAGGIAGIIGNTAVVSRCYNGGAVLAGERGAAGIVGYNMGKVEFSQNDGEIAADYFNAYRAAGNQDLAGGIVGMNYGEIDNSLNTGFISTYNRIGGISGSNSAGTYVGKISKSVNIGMLRCLSDDNYRGGIAGFNSNSVNITDSYYDLQICNFGGTNNATISGIKGLLTKELISGVAISNLPDSIWAFNSNMYPALKDFVEEESTIAARHSFVVFADEETMNVVKTEAQLAEVPEISWSLKVNDEFQINSQKLTVTIPEDKVGYDTLVAVYDGKYRKEFALKVIPEILKGYGTESNPWLIETTEDMTTLAEFMRDSGMDYAGNHFLLVNDLDYTDIEYTPIAFGSSVRFQGYFNGNNKKITNLSYTNSTTAGRYVGLFGSVGYSGTIANLTLESGAFNAHSYVGGIVGNLYGSIVNCTNKATITSVSSGYAGGITAYAYEGASIHKTANYGMVTSSGTYTAGIAAYVMKNVEIEECYNAGQLLAGGNFCGGIAGLSSGKIVNSYNIGNIGCSGTRTHAGGIVGSHAENDTIIGCYNTGRIEFSSYVGGIAGAATQTGGVIRDSYNSGAVIANNSGDIGGIIGRMVYGNHVYNCYNEGSVTGAKSYVGGVIGYMSGNANYETTLEKSHNKGLIKGETTYVGGVVGSAPANVTVDDCYNLGNVTAGTNFVGGFSGSGSGAFTNCWNAGDVNAGGYGVGGFSGIGSGTATNCFNLGNVTALDVPANATLASVGGVWGYGRPVLTNCYNMGTLTAPDNIAGVIGMAFANLEVYNCYNAGQIITTESSELVGNIVRPNTLAGVVVENCYYDKTINTRENDADIFGIGLTTEEMTEAALGEGYINEIATYPLLVSMEGNTRAGFYAALVFLGEENSFEDINRPFTIGTPSGVEWTATEHLLIEGNEARPMKKGEATLTLTAGELKRDYHMTVTYEPDAIGEDAISKECIEEIYYNLDGVRVTIPIKGIYILKKVYDDDSYEVEKVIIK